MFRRALITAAAAAVLTGAGAGTASAETHRAGGSTADLGYDVSQPGRGALDWPPLTGEVELHGELSGWVAAAVGVGALAAMLIG